MEKYRFLWSLLLVSLSSILFSCSDDDEVTADNKDRIIKRDWLYNGCLWRGDQRGKWDW